jgi:octaheme c-type cytochrome (tetrathionate reductase family)
MPSPDVDLINVAQHVGKTSRKTCGECHFNGGGGDAIKHADMSENLIEPERNCDVHMGGYDFQCTECHKTHNHKISGRSTSVAATEGSVSCKDCHTETPHYEDSLMDHHLNKHCEHLSCNTCHSPLYAKCKPTKTWWDWSKAGDKKRKPVKDKYGMEDYNFKKGEFKWKESAKPDYAWYNGAMKRVEIGDKVNLDVSKINITEPVGSFLDKDSRISPFKIMKGVQAADAEYNYFLIPHLFPRDKDDTTAYWKNLDWQKSFTDGMKAAKLPYSGDYQWIETWTYWGVEHEVMPAESALSCTQCHQSLVGENSCNRCHQDQRNIDYQKLSNKGIDFKQMEAKGRDVKDLIDKTDYLDFEALGYKGDPVLHGGRFKKMPLGIGKK